ncbi:hypothetical protein M569_11003, partial [Genlisea aurea]
AMADVIPKVRDKKKLIKKKKKKLKKSGVSSDSEDRDTIESLLEPFSKEQLLTLVTDLSLTHDSLFSLIEDLNVVTDRATGKCKGYAFLTFKSRKSAKQLLENPRVQVGNRLTSCQLASEGAPASVVSRQVFQADYPQRKIYVNNVPPNASADKLRAFFDKFGEIEFGPKGLDPATGRFKGYAIFVYKTVEGAKKVLEQPLKFFDGTQLFCQRATEGKGKTPVGGAASITTVLQPFQPQMLAAVAAAQQVQNMALLGQQAGMINPLYIQNPNLGALMGGGYYGMIGDQSQGVGGHVPSSSVEGGPNGGGL